MNQTFRKTDYSKLFFIRTRLIFPMCLIYTPVTETLLKEILMKKEEEFLQIVSQSIYVQGLSREWSGFAQRWWKSSCPESLSQGFVTLSDLYRALQRKFVICLFPRPKLCPVLPFWPTAGETWAAPAFLRASLTGWLSPCLFLEALCLQAVPQRSKCRWALAGMIQPVSLSNCFMVNSEILSIYDVPLVHLNFVSIPAVQMRIWPGIYRERILYIWKKITVSLIYIITE